MKSARAAAGGPANGSRMAATVNDCTHTSAARSAPAAKRDTATIWSAKSAAPASVHASPTPSVSPERSESRAEPAMASAIPATSRAPGRCPSSGHAQNAASSVPAQVRNAELPAEVERRPTAWK